MSAAPVCGVLGVGALGGAIAERLAAAGLTVHAHDRSPERVAALAGDVRACATPRELAAACDV
ncbi:NAD(P)-binding domain-containing protein, partial [Patulibacter medicamentivorans]|uniref:NAD(P)-binding domain-containing protein n=1 Tax=Patulibacter medicamentivorans TaxID=1097667 RepID=UPI000590312A